jgi:hypothetical protein
MEFKFDPSNQAILNTELVTIVSDFVRLNMIGTSPVVGLTYETIKAVNLLPLFDPTTAPTQPYLSGIRIVPGIRSNQEFRLTLVPTLAVQLAEYDKYRVFEMNTSSDVADLISNSDCYWISNNAAMLLNSNQQAEALADYQRYMSLIQISHDGTGDNGSFGGYVDGQDTATVWINKTAISALVEGNKDANDVEPEFVYLSWGMVPAHDDQYQTTFAASIYKPGLTAPSVPVSNAFSNKSQDCNHICPLICGYVIIENDHLVL